MNCEFPLYVYVIVANLLAVLISLLYKEFLMKRPFLPVLIILITSVFFIIYSALINTELFAYIGIAGIILCILAIISLLFNAIWLQSLTKREALQVIEEYTKKI